MNILKAIKSGKDFKRDGWDFWCGKEEDHFFWISNDGKKLIATFSPDEVMADDWEVKELIVSGSYKGIVGSMMEEEKTFDPTKPVQTRDGRPARIICDNLKSKQPIIAIIDCGNEQEFYQSVSINGNFNNSDQTSNLDLINIPEPKPIDIHVGGIYRFNNNNIGICITYGSFEDKVILDISNSKFILIIDNDDVEHLGDIQDLSPYIKDKLK